MGALLCLWKSPSLFSWLFFTKASKWLISHRNDLSANGCCFSLIWKFSSVIWTQQQCNICWEWNLMILLSKKMNELEEEYENTNIFEFGRSFGATCAELNEDYLCSFWHEQHLKRWLILYGEQDNCWCYQATESKAIPRTPRPPPPKKKEDTRLLKVRPYPIPPPPPSPPCPVRSRAIFLFSWSLKNWFYREMYASCKS